MKTRGRAWRRYKNDVKTIYNIKRRYYSWLQEPRNSIELDADLSWYQCINGYNWIKSKQKTEKIQYKDLYDLGDYPEKKWYRPKMKEYLKDEIKRFYNEIY